MTAIEHLRKLTSVEPGDYYCGYCGGSKHADVCHWLAAKRFLEQVDSASDVAIWHPDHPRYSGPEL